MADFMSPFNTWNNKVKLAMRQTFEIVNGNIVTMYSIFMDKSRKQDASRP